MLAAAIFLFVIIWCVVSRINSGPGADMVSAKHAVAPDSLPYFLALSDIHLHHSVNQDKITFWRADDTGDDLWDSAQNKIAGVLAGKAGFTPPKFIVVLGDLPWHAKDDNQDDIENAHKSTGQVLHDLRELSENAHIPLLYVSGNNDPWDGDYHPFSTKIFGLDSAGQSMWPVINPVPYNSGTEQANIIDKSMLGMGCYSAYPLGKKGKLRVIALNTTMFVPAYTDKSHQQADDSLQMRWFAGQLEEAEAANEVVFIALHVPPGIDGYKKKEMWDRRISYNDESVQDAFIDLLDKYKNRIAGVLSSHTHMDGIRKIYNKEGKLISIDISVPGITPGHGNNPSFKLISYQPDNYELENFITFYEDFYKDKKVISWGDDAFDFRGEFGCQNGASIRRCLDTLNNTVLQNAIQSIYTVIHGRGKVEEVDTAINVRYD